MEKYDAIQGGEQEMSNRGFWAFKAWVLVAQVLGLLSVVLTAVWVGHYKGGFAWQENPAKEFNYHPLFMILGMVFLYGDSILAYRVCRNFKKIYIKLLHMALHILALVFAGVGLKAVFDSHNLPKPPIANMYSLHSWAGITTVILFALQWLFGFVTFLVPGLSRELRALYKPMHVFWGLAIFLLAVATSLMGLTEKESLSNDGYHNKNAEGIVVNCLGLCLISLAVVVGYILTKPEYQRQPTPDEEQMQLTQ